MPGTMRKTARETVPEVERFWAKVESGQAVGHHYVTLLGLRAVGTAALLRRLAEGLSFRAWERLMNAMALSTEAAARLVQITPRTLSRRKEGGRLDPEESDRLLRVARVFAKALILFEGDLPATRAWLVAAQPALGGATPLEYVRTEVGSREVEDLIGRLEFGVPS